MLLELDSFVEKKALARGVLENDGWTSTACLHELFEVQVDACEDAVALVCGDISLSYGELDAHCNRLAHYLRFLNIGPGKLVGVFFDRSELPIFALLAILKAGAAYVPIDPVLPDDRIRYILAEAKIAALLTERVHLERSSELFRGPTVALDDCPAIRVFPSRRLTRVDTGVSNDDLCYVIYTSGTTGYPKGVMTEHQNASHFISAFNRVCTITDTERIYQGFSLSFDGSVEEIWMAFSNGATLVVPTRDAPKFGPDLAIYLAQQKVTYLSTVPTMLWTLNEDVPTLRWLVVSGEICTPELVARWARPGRRMLNVYGPTEATVNTTATHCVPGRPVTIGQPLSGYEILILDEDMRPVAKGVKGELFVGGRSISRGYLDQPELTAKSFLTSLYDGRRLYRTGDLVRLNDDGEIEFFGRMDSQIKVRGYRVEPSEIEMVLREQRNVAASAVTLWGEAEMPILAAHITLTDKAAPIDRGVLLATLRSRLPCYMIPTYLDVVNELPVLTSGKLNRKALPDPVSPLVDVGDIGVPPKTPMERIIAEVWAAAFGIAKVGVEQDFFMDLGGHSLLAARTTSMLRSADLQVAVRDIYSFPTVRKLAKSLEEPSASTDASRESTAEVPGFASLPRAPSGAMAVTQGAWIVSLSFALSTPLFITLPVLDDLLHDRGSAVAAVGFITAMALATPVLMMALSIAGKWLIIGRYRSGAYPLWGSFYLRWWLVRSLQALSGASLLAGTPLLPTYYRLMGAKIGRGCSLRSTHCAAFDLVSIGDDSSIGPDTQLYGHRIENGYLLIGGIEIGKCCFVGAHSALGLGVRMEDGARLDDLSLLPDKEVIPAGEHWRGSPARPAEVTVPGGELLRAGSLRVLAFTFVAVALGALLAMALSAPVIGVTFALLSMFLHGLVLESILGAVLAIPLLVIFTCVWVALLKVIILNRAKPGIYPLYSIYHLRYWLVSGLMRACRTMLLPVFTTLYLPPWLRLLGAKIGAHAEMSTIWSLVPDLLTAGEGSFFADGCMIGGSRCFGGRFEIRRNSVGARSFVGNSAMLQTGASLGENSLLGVLSTLPHRTERTPDGTDWLGSPGFRLPNRQKVEGFDEKTTFRPTPRLYAERAVIDALRILIPAFVAVGLGLVAVIVLLYTYETYGLWLALAVDPVLDATVLGCAVMIVVALKWSAMGRFQPVVVPLWRRYIWLNEMVNGAYESIMAPIVAIFFGTPFAAPLLRLLGCKIGRNCYIETNLFSEFDLVDIGDHVALNAGVIIQSHLFEDRIMKSSYLQIGDECSVGNMSVVLYDTRMENRATLGPLSLLMKGETMPANSRWRGIPTVRG
jgi:non-ribosomal peptide synthetase-like protein